MDDSDKAHDDLEALWDHRDPAESERRFRAAMEGAPQRSTYRIELLTQIARAQGLQRRFDDAIATLDDAASRLADAGPRAAIRERLERGRVLRSSGDAGGARPLFAQAWELASASGADALAVDAAHMLALVARGDDALRWNATALELAESSGDPAVRRWIGSLHNNIGWAHHAADRFDAALAHFERAAAFRREHGTEAEVLVARWCLGRCLRSLDRIEEALALHRELSRAHERLGGEDGYVEEEIGECLLALGRGGDAAPHFAKAHALLSVDPWLAEAEPDRLRRLERLATAP